MVVKIIKAEGRFPQPFLCWLTGSSFLSFLGEQDEFL
jgi:hypothetical protein